MIGFALVGTYGEGVVDPLVMFTGLADSVPQVAHAALNAEPAGLLPARQQMALSLGWHIILACFGVAFPAMIFVMHLIGIPA